MPSSLHEFNACVLLNLPRADRMRIHVRGKGVLREQSGLLQQPDTGHDLLPADRELFEWWWRAGVLPKG